jgi:anti-anti-sigma factor
VRDQFSIVVHDDRTAIDGELDASSAPRLDAALNKAAPPIRLELVGVTFIDSACINVLVRHHARVRAIGGELRIVSASGSVTRVLELTGLVDVLAPAMAATRSSA